MRFLLSVFMTCMTSLIFAQTPVSSPEKLPFAPALYTLRATKNRGSALILLDTDGHETVIHKDSRTSKKNSAHFGPFSCTPDGSLVIYTLFGTAIRPKTEPNLLTMGSAFTGVIGAAVGGAIGGALASKSPHDIYGTHSFEGLFIWEKATGKSKQLWNIRDLEQINKTSSVFFELNYRSFQEDVEVNAPSYLFHLKDQKFLWITCSALILIDPVKHICQPLGACQKNNADFRSEAFHAWQEADGTVHAFRSNSYFQVNADGVLKDQLTEKNSWFNGFPTSKKGFIEFDGKQVTIFDRDDNDAFQKRASLQGKFTDLRFLPETNCLMNCYFNKTGNLILERIEENGPVSWVADIGVCTPDLYVNEQEGKFVVLVRRKSSPVGIHRVTIHAGSGAILEDVPFEINIKPDPDQKTQSSINVDDFMTLSVSQGLEFQPSTGPGFKLKLVHSVLGYDMLQKLGQNDQLIWRTNVGPTASGIHAKLNEDNLLLYLARPDKPKQNVRLFADLATGEIDFEMPWLSPAEKREYDFSLPLSPEFKHLAYTIPTVKGTLAWLPNTGEIETPVNGEGWVSTAKRSELINLHAMGLWLWVDSGLQVRPLWGRALADEMVVVIQGRPTPLFNWSNNNIMIGAARNPYIGWAGEGVSLKGLSNPLWQGRYTIFPTGHFNRAVPSHLQKFAASWLGSVPPAKQLPQTTNVENSK